MRRDQTDPVSSRIISSRWRGRPIFAGATLRNSRSTSGMKNLAKTVNEMLFRVFRFERHWIPRWRAPLGLSLLAVAGRPVERTDGR